MVTVGGIALLSVSDSGFTSYEAARSFPSLLISTPESETSDFFLILKQSSKHFIFYFLMSLFLYSLLVQCQREARSVFPRKQLAIKDYVSNLS